MRLAAVSVVAGLAVLAAGASRAAPEPACRPRVTDVAAERIRAALAAGRDVWGLELLRAPGGPTYEAAAGRLGPIHLARAPLGRSLTGSGAYYLAFAMPRGPADAPDAMLHVADGSEILARRATGPSLRVLVGSDGREAYGSCLGRLRLARLLNGWLPVLRTSYRDASGGSWAQESFAARGGGRLSSYVRLSGSASASAPARVVLGPLSFAVPAGAARTVYVRWSPPGDPVRIGAAAYERARASVGAYWRARLAEGASLEIPERRVADALRALLVQELSLTWRYSLGNAYEQVSFPEAIDTARVLGELGFGAVERAILVAALPARPTPYPSWKKGEKLLGFADRYRRLRDRATLAAVEPTLRRFLAALEGALGRNGLLARERYSSDVAERVYGLHALARVWQALRAIAPVWRELGRSDLAGRAELLAARLEAGLRSAISRSQRRLPDGSLFVPMRLLGGVAPYGRVTESRAGSYWNLVAPYALASGLLSREAVLGVLRYVDLHGARLLGLVRTAAPVLYGPGAGGEVSGVNPVYGNNASRFLAALDRPDRLVLALYGQLAAGMTPHTFAAGEGTTVAPLAGALHRTTYLPPNAAANASFLATLRLLLVHEREDALELAFATPRAWLAPGKRIAVRALPTRFGPVSYSLAAGARVVRVRVEVPSRDPPPRLLLRLRLPGGGRIGTVTPGRPVDRAAQTIDLSGLRGTVELEVTRAGASRDVSSERERRGQARRPPPPSPSRRRCV